MKEVLEYFGIKESEEDEYYLVDHKTSKQLLYLQNIAPFSFKNKRDY